MRRNYEVWILHSFANYRLFLNETYFENDDMVDFTKIQSTQGYIYFLTQGLSADDINEGLIKPCVTIEETRINCFDKKNNKHWFNIYLCNQNTTLLHDHVVVIIMVSSFIFKHFYIIFKTKI